MFINIIIFFAKTQYTTHFGTEPAPSIDLQKLFSKYRPWQECRFRWILWVIAVSICVFHTKHGFPELLRFVPPIYSMAVSKQQFDCSFGIPWAIPSKTMTKIRDKIRMSSRLQCFYLFILILRVYWILLVSFQINLIRAEFETVSTEAEMKWLKSFFNALRWLLFTGIYLFLQKNTCWSNSMSYFGII